MEIEAVIALITALINAEPEILAAIESILNLIKASGQPATLADRTLLRSSTASV